MSPKHANYCNKCDSSSLSNDYKRSYDKVGLTKPKHEQHYERIRVVGRGSYGMAVLYRRKDDKSLVIIKKINLYELNCSERQLALNEVIFLARLRHPHIISYYDSFEKDGVLMIEMEYADGGTLTQFLSKQTGLIAESEVVFIFEQMACAVAYLHKNHIIHRDIKTENIFLIAENMVKLGDFGISKHLGTSTNFHGAQTIVGTPYYLSPEMCKGYTYGEKSDIWALGCCLYKMVCLRKTFNATHLPILMNKIVNAEYEQIKGSYSNQLKLLLREMLQTNPDQRLCATRVLKIVQLHQNQFLKKSNSMKNAVRNDLNHNTHSQFRSNANSTIYQYDVKNVTLTVIPTVPIKLKVKQLVVGVSHQILLTVDAQAYSWGFNSHGQLGHGDCMSREIPTLIEAFGDKTVTKIAAGRSFCIFCVDQGIAMACGDRRFMGDTEIKKDWLKPRIIDTLLSLLHIEEVSRRNVIDLACGEDHAVALCENGDVFAWGRGEAGQLGNGECSDVFIPTKVDIPTHQIISNVKCGPDCTLFITSRGTALVTGSNRFNKLNLNKRIGFFANEFNELEREVKKVLTPTALPIKAFRSRVIDAELGRNHSGVLLENGQIHLFGSNANGELGIGNCTPASTFIACVKVMQKKTCVHLICGDGFTMVVTADNELYFWGSRDMKDIDDYDEVALNVYQAQSDNNRQHLLRKAFYSFHTRCNGKSIKNVLWRDNEDGSLPLLPTLPTQNNTLVLHPTIVLRLDVERANSTSTPKSSVSVNMASLICNRNKVFVVIDTYSSSAVSRNSCSNTLTDDSKSAACSITNNQALERSETGKPTDLQMFTRGVKEMLKKISYNTEEEKNIIEDIQTISDKLQKRTETSENYNKYMNELATKMAELEVLKEKDCSRSKIIKNPFATEIQTKICVIL